MSNSFILPKEWVEVCAWFGGSSVHAEKVDTKFGSYCQVILMEHDSKGTSTLYLKIGGPKRLGGVPMINGRLLVTDVESSPFKAESFSFHDSKKAIHLINTHFNVDPPTKGEIEDVLQELKEVGGGVLNSGWVIKSQPELPRFVHSRAELVPHVQHLTRLS